jgi:hypothetical protein
VTFFNKLRNTTSSGRQAAHQDAYSKDPFSLPGKSMQWIPFVPKYGGLIQVGISGHPPIPTGSKQFSGNLLLLAFFQILNFWDHFEGLNDIFFGYITSIIV